MNWEEFHKLDGGPQKNFEILCRHLIHLHYGSYGKIDATSNQPGVEFHLRLERSAISLGNPPDWFGWQCKWFETNKDNSLTSSQRKQIEHSLRTSEKEFGLMTDWVLWTRRPLTRKDVRWYESLKTRFNLHRWDEARIETYLAGEALLLRRTFFGELVLTWEQLKQNHENSIARVRNRWLESVHQPTESEREVRRRLGEANAWPEVDRIRESLEMGVKVLEKSLPTLPPTISESIGGMISAAEETIHQLLLTKDTLMNGDYDKLRSVQEFSCPGRDRRTLSVPRLLRRENSIAAPYATNILEDIKEAYSQIAGMEGLLNHDVVALIAPAGGGKTQMAAELTKSTEQRPAGILFHGHDLRKGGSMDELARAYRIHGLPVGSMELLIASLDFAAQRAKCRLPIVIDGLNESEDPRDWKQILAEIRVVIKRYPGVLLVCTLRTGAQSTYQVDSPWDGSLDKSIHDRDSFAERALPGEFQKIYSEGFGGDVEEAIDKYFSHYKISADDAEIPMEFLSHPLTLRIFCESINPERKKIVIVENFPSSLTPLMRDFLNHVAKRIAEMPRLSHPCLESEISRGIHRLGIEWWKIGRREILQGVAEQVLGDDFRAWDSKLVNLLAQEGVVFRNPTGPLSDHLVIPSYDALGGHIIAASLFALYPTDRFLKWLDKEYLVNLFGESAHELASDIFNSLVALTPSYFPGVKFWQVVNPRFKVLALQHTLSIEPSALDDVTIKEVEKYFATDLEGFRILLNMIFPVRSNPEHPLNANYIYDLLAKMSVSERDLKWSEWVRASRQERRNDLRGNEKRWKKNTERTEADFLRAKWFMWLLTSTDHELRDLATRTLYWFGRGSPGGIFELCIASLQINDPYICERMLAVSYGVAMAIVYQDGGRYGGLVSNFARKVFDEMFAVGARYATSHVLIREYGRRILELANCFDAKCFSFEEGMLLESSFEKGWKNWGEKLMSGDEYHGLDSPFRMDFENYTLGGLVPGRGNYQFNNEDYKKVRSKILWRVEELGWTADAFKVVDQECASANPYSRNNDSKKVDRYGKKYSMIAYLEMKGELRDKGVIDGVWRERTSDVDIDPSFPDYPMDGSPFDVDMLGSSISDTGTWIEEGAIPDLKRYLRYSNYQGVTGNWILLDGAITQSDETRNRRSFCYVRSFLVKEKVRHELTEHLVNQSLAGRWLPEIPDYLYTFAGEMPWCSIFHANGTTEMSFITGVEKIKKKRREEVLFYDGKRLAPSELEEISKRFHDDPEEFERSEAQRLSLKKLWCEYEEEKELIRDISVSIPVAKYGWEGHQSSANESSGVTVLAKEIALDLNLHPAPQSFNLFDESGVQATLSMEELEGDWLNTQSMMAIREDLLLKYMSRHRLSIVWAVWGERELSGKSETSNAGKRYEVFQQIFDWKSIA